MTLTFSGMSSDTTAAHIHGAAFGSNGGVALTLFSGVQTSPFTNTYDLSSTPSVITAIQSGDTYVNVHTSSNAGGELRGQIV